MLPLLTSLMTAIEVLVPLERLMERAEFLSKGPILMGMNNQVMLDYGKAFATLCSLLKLIQKRPQLRVS